MIDQAMRECMIGCCFGCATAVILVVIASTWLAWTPRDSSISVVVADSPLHVRLNLTLGCVSPAQRQQRLDAAHLGCLPGELPTYTGWERPTASLAPWFTLENSSQRPHARVSSGSTHSIVVRCAGAEAEECRHGGSVLEARWIGPSVLRAVVTDLGDGSYRLSAVLHDPGTYFVEAWVAFSRAPRGGSSHVQPSGFEGYPLLPHPVWVHVLPVGPPPRPLPWCHGRSLSDLQGRWRVVWKASGLPIAGEEVAPRTTRLGIRMEWFPLRCHILRRRDLLSAPCKGSSLWKRCSPIGANIVFVGDSTVRLQHAEFTSMWTGGVLDGWLSGWTATYFSLGDMQRPDSTGLRAVLEALRSHVAEQRRRKVRVVVVLNSGLHNMQPCIVSGVSAKCVGRYREGLRSLLAAVVATRPDLTIYRTTNLVFPRYGNWGFRWADGLQGYAQSRFFQVPFQHAEREVLSAAMGHHRSTTNHSTLWVVNGSAISDPRDDHTEDRWRQPGAAQVHHGPEVVGAQNTLIVTIVLSELCPLVLKRCQRVVESTCSSESGPSSDDDSTRPLGGRLYALAEAIVDKAAQVRERHDTGGEAYGGKLGLPRASAFKNDGPLADGSIEQAFTVARRERGFQGRRHRRHR